MTTIDDNKEEETIPIMFLEMELDDSGGESERSLSALGGSEAGSSWTPLPPLKLDHNEVILRMSPGVLPPSTTKNPELTTESSVKSFVTSNASGTMMMTTTTSRRPGTVYYTRSLSSIQEGGSSSSSFSSSSSQSSIDSWSSTWSSSSTSSSSSQGRQRKISTTTTATSTLSNSPPPQMRTTDKEVIPQRFNTTATIIAVPPKKRLVPIMMTLIMTYTLGLLQCLHLQNSHHHKARKLEDLVLAQEQRRPKYNRNLRATEFDRDHQLQQQQQQQQQLSPSKEQAVINALPPHLNLTNAMNDSSGLQPNVASPNATNDEVKPNVSSKPLGSDNNQTQLTRPSIIDHKRTVNIKSHARPRFPRIPSQSNTKVIFYHIYLPPNNTQNALRIVQEQLQQMGGNKDVTLLYNTVGVRHVLTPKLMNQWCQLYNLRACHFMGHHDTGWEEITLQNVHQFCQLEDKNNQKHPEAPRPTTRRVGYVHNKGSYHPTSLNEAWRYEMTKALVKDECWPTANSPFASSSSQSSIKRRLGDGKISMATDNSNSTLLDQQQQQCNLCGLYFTTDRGLYMSGNVWTADCQYVNQLMDPAGDEFRTKSIEATQDALLKKMLGQFQMTQYPSDRHPMFFGIGRYAAEWWIASHPTVRPCDFSKSLLVPSSPTIDENETTTTFNPKAAAGYDRTKQFLEFLNQVHQAATNLTDHDEVMVEATSNRTTNSIEDDDKWSRFTPEAPGLSYKFARPKMVSNRRKVKVRGDSTKREYFLLPGRIHRWLYLYGQLPPEDSWVWKHYPQGKWWKQAVKDYGNSVLDHVLPPPADNF